MEIKNEVTVVLPTEVEQLANQVSTEKREIIIGFLNTVFSKTSEWKQQVDAIDVKGVNDKVSMGMAEVIYKAAKDERLAFEKKFDAKRDEVQAQMLEFKTEDSLLLKAKQTMQILTKEVQDIARYKADFVKRYESEQKELRTQQRMVRVAKFNQELNRSEFENMSGEMFTIFIGGIEKAFNDKIEAEADRLEAIRVESERVKAIEIENEKLRIAAIEKEKEAEIERKKQAQEAEKIRLENQKKLDEVNRLAKIEKDKQDAIIAKQKEQSDLLAKQLRDRQDAELKAKQEAECKAKEAELEAKKAAKAPEKQRIINWIDSFKPADMVFSDNKQLSPAAVIITDNIIEKFGAFKKWAKYEIEKL